MNPKCIKLNCEREAVGTTTSVRGPVPICAECAARQNTTPTPFVTVAEVPPPPRSATKKRNPKKSRPPRDLAPEELEHRKALREHKQAQARALEALAPALPLEGEDVHDRGGRLVDVTHVKEIEPLVRIPRVSGTGAPGSSLALSLRSYDGAQGGHAGKYVHAFVEARTAYGVKFRTRGVKILASDLDDVIAALVRAKELMAS